MEDFKDSKYTYFVPDEDSLSEEENLDNGSSGGQKENEQQRIIKKSIKNNIWLSLSEAANLGGIQTKTIRRAIKNKKDLRYKIVNNKYRIELRSLIIFMHSTKKLENKFYKCGLGQYVQKWRR